MLPVHPRLKPGEALSSWIVRVARGNGLKLHTFNRLVAPAHAMWNRDIDNSASDALLQCLAKRTVESPECLRGATLQSYVGSLMAYHNPNGLSKWVTPVGVYHRTRRRFGQQYCPGCLATEEPYFRIGWRLAVMTICENHARLLADRCPRCGGPIEVQRHDFTDRTRTSYEAFSTCPWCEADLCCVADLQADVTAEDIRVHSALLHAIEARRFTLGDGEDVDSVELFAALHQLMKLVARSGDAARLRSVVEHELRLPAPSAEYGQSKELEFESVQDRHHMLRLAYWLLDDWPQHLSFAAEESHVKQSDILRDMRKPPPWFEGYVRRTFWGMRPCDVGTMARFAAKQETQRRSSASKSRSDSRKTVVTRPPSGKRPLQTKRPRTARA